MATEANEDASRIFDHLTNFRSSFCQSALAMLPTISGVEITAGGGCRGSYSNTLTTTATERTIQATIASAAAQAASTAAATETASTTATVTEAFAATAVMA